MKYANASIISVSVKEQNANTIIVVKDNGNGFDFDQIENGNGLKNMRKRIEEINGEFQIESSDLGTTITIIV